MQTNETLTISTEFQGRMLNLFLLQGEVLFLIDTGVAGMPEKLIFPFMEENGLHREAVALVANTHAHADHMGGNAEIVARCPGAQIGAHVLDKPWIEDHALLWGEFYARHPLQRYGADDRETMLALCGAGAQLQHAWHGGERLDIGGHVLDVIHAPGHTPGNLAFLDRKGGVLFEGETILGGPTGPVGRLQVPFYHDVAAYRATLRSLAALPWELLLSSHAVPRDRQAGMRAIQESLDLVDLVHEQVLMALADAGRPISLGELVSTISARHGYEAMAPAWLAATHLDYLEATKGAYKLPDGRWRSLA